jgi:HlyD family secretion protein
MKKKFWIIIAVIAVIAAVGGYFLLKAKKKDNYEWRTAKVERGDVKVVVTATGSLSADTTVLVGTQVSGTISKILVDFNSVVRKGQIIAIIDTTFLAAAVVDSKASLNKADVQVDLTKRTFERTKELFDEKVMAQADYDQAWSDYQTAVANQRSARAALDRAYINLRYATIKAPVSGVVVSRAVDVGQTVAASFSTPTLFSIANDLTKMQVQASIDEADIGKIQVGQDVSFTVDAYDNITFKGKVRQIRLQPTVVQNVVNYTVIIDVPNPDLKLLPGMTANITVNIQEADSVLKVPSSALRFNPPEDVIAEMMTVWPDSIKQKVEGWMQGSKKAGGQGSGAYAQNGNAAGGQAGSGQGGYNRQGGAGGQAGQEGYSSQGRTGQGMNRRGGQNGEVKKWKMDVGFVWIKKDKILTPHRVRLGLTDGSYTEVKGRIDEGDEVVIGMINSGQTVTTTQQQSPFMPQMGRRR